MYCEKCGAQISDRAKFCRFCGAEVIPELSEISEYQRELEEREQRQQSRNKYPDTQNTGYDYKEEYEDESDIDVHENARFNHSINKAAALEGVGRAKEAAGQYLNDIKDAAGKAAGKAKGIKINKKLLFLILGSILAVAVVVGVGFAVISTNKKTINLNDYLTIEYSGNSGNANAYGYVDFYQIETDCADKLSGTQKYRSEREFYGASPADYLGAFISVDINNEYNLSNGDELKYTWNIQDDIYDYFDVKLKCKDGKETVSGLKEEIDPFDYFHISFSGTDGSGEASVTTDDFIQKTTGYFELENDRNLSNGDEILVEFVINDDILTERGYYIKSFMNSYTVSGLEEKPVVEVTPSPVIMDSQEKEDTVETKNDSIVETPVQAVPASTSAAIGNPKTIYDIPDNIKADFRRMAEEKIRQNVDQTWADAEYLDRSEYVGQYIVSREDVNNVGDNQVGVVFKNYVSILKDGWTPHGVEYYYVLVFRNLYIKDNGEYTYDKPFEPQNSVYVYPPSGGTYYYTGFEDLDGMNASLVNPLLKKYQFTADY